MANVQVIQRSAHLVAAPQLEYVNGREGQIAKALLIAISNSRRGSGEARSEEATAIQWTLWGAQAESAAQYLVKGSHVNVVGRLRNNNYVVDDEQVFGWTFTAEEIDYLDTKSQGDALRERQAGPAAKAGSEQGAKATKPRRSVKGGKSDAPSSAAGDDDIPF